MSDVIYNGGTRRAPVVSSRPLTSSWHARLVKRAIRSAEIARRQRGRGQDDLAVCTEHAVAAAVHALKTRRLP